MDEWDEILLNEVYTLLTRLKAKGFPDAMSEQAVKIAVIIPILNALDWDSTDTDEVIPEYAVKSRKADFALVHRKKPRILIEVKAPALDLSEKHRDQLTSYAYHVGAGIAILTNGRLWEFYVPSAPGEWKQRMACEIDILRQDPNDAAQQFLHILSKARVASSRAQLYANEVLNTIQRKEEIAEALPSAWRNMLLDPDEHLVALLAEKTETICGFKPDSSQVSKFLRSKLNALEEQATASGLTLEPPQLVEGQERTRRARGGITQRELEPFILAALLELGGSANNRSVKQHVHQKVESRLTKADYSKDRSGRVRWSYYCDWARNSLAERDLIKRDSPRGVWELTEKGIREAQRIADRPNRN